MRAAVVTGAARGIGAAVVRRLVSDGWCVVAVDRCADDPVVPYALARPEELAELAADFDGAVVPLVADVRLAATSREAVALAVERFGGIDAAVACAAVIAGGRPLWLEPEEVFDLLVDVDLRSVAHLARAAVPALLARPEPRSGRFVAVASAAAHTGLPGLASYGAAKHAVLGLVLGLADDLAGTGVTATAVSPGSTNTEMLAATAELYGLADVAEFTRHQSIGRIIEPDEVAAAIAWLASEGASAITGTSLRVDGGFKG